MKYKSITYDVTIGSHWPDVPRPTLPVGGRRESITLALPERIDHPKPMDFADKLLNEYMQKTYPGQTYHIWYWDWSVIREEEEKE